MSQDEHTVRIEPQRRILRVAATQPVLEAALAAGLNLPHSCKSGHCGSCRARLRSGQISYPNGVPLGITAEEQAAGHILLCQARAQSDLEVEARFIAGVGEVEIKTLPARIAGLVPLAPDVMQVLLRLPTVEPLRFRAGQYLDVLLPDGRRRSFSIASPPHDNELIELHVRRVAGGGFSERLFGPAAAAAPADGLSLGSLLRIEGPVGQFVYRDGTGAALMVAGGTGFAPLKSMLRHVLENGVPRDIHLYWGRATPRTCTRRRACSNGCASTRGCASRRCCRRPPWPRPRTTASASCTMRCSPTTRTSARSRCTPPARRP